VAKAGTMSLIEYLNLHHDIHCTPGEKHFFDKTPYNQPLSLEAQNNYEKLFLSNKKIIGEKSPSYCYLQFAIDRIYNYNPHIKLILILREPIARAYSHYNMHLENRPNYGNIPYMQEFEKEKNAKLSKIKTNEDYYIVRGFYDEIIEYILYKFSKENLYICISEEVLANKQFEYNKIYNFLGADDIVINKSLDVHKRKYKFPIPDDLALMLYGVYKPHNAKLYKILGRKIDIWENHYQKHFIDISKTK